MSYKKLFNEEYESYNEHGNRFYDEANKLLEPLISKWINEGFSSRDIEHHLIALVGCISSEKRLDRACKVKQEKKMILGALK